MRASERVDHLTELRELTALVSTSQPAAVQKLHEWSAGFPSGADGGGGKGGHSDRTEALALKGDPFTRDLGLLDASLELALGAMREAHRICLVATKHEVADEALPACKSCARAKDWQHKPYYSPVRANNVCRWCEDWVRTHGAWPPVKIVELHNRGQRISEQMVAQALKSA